MMDSAELLKLAVDALDDLKAFDIRVMDVRDVTSITDYMVIASGNSVRQVQAMADRVVELAKERGTPPLGMEGHQTGEWVLVDLGDVIVHAMHPTARLFYQLEKLWSGMDGDTALPEMAEFSSQETRARA